VLCRGADQHPIRCPHIVKFMVVVIDHARSCPLVLAHRGLVRWTWIHFCLRPTSGRAPYCEDPQEGEEAALENLSRRCEISSSFESIKGAGRWGRLSIWSGTNMRANSSLTRPTGCLGTTGTRSPSRWPPDPSDSRSHGRGSSSQIQILQVRRKDTEGLHVPEHKESLTDFVSRLPDATAVLRPARS